MFYLGLVVLAVVVAVATIGTLNSRALLKESHRECAELKAQVEAREQTISQLQIKLANEQNLESIPRSASLPAGSEALLELRRRLEELAVQQTNILALVQRDRKSVV